MRTLSAVLTALLLAAPRAGLAQSFSQLADAAGGDIPPVAAPEPVAAEVEQEPGSETLRADFDFLVRPEAEHEPGAELFDIGELAAAPAGAELSRNKAALSAAPGTKTIPFLEIARSEAKAQGVDLSLVLAVIQKESSFDPNARSAAGARGLMQMLPSTAKWLGLKDTKQLTKPAVNIKYGVKYLKYLWDEFAGIPSGDLTAEQLRQRNAQMAIAAYNAGQGNVRKYNDVPPFKETRNYVKKVSEYFAQYESLLPSILTR
jgi:soluble lytic murein transglycosylase-like protein